MKKINKDIKKIVKVKSNTTKSGINTCKSEERTLKLYDATSKRSARVGRMAKIAHINSGKDLSTVSGIPPGAIGRILRGDSCLSTATCFQLAEKTFNNRSEIGNRVLTNPSFLMGKSTQEPVPVTNTSGIELIDLLQELLSNYSGFTTVLGAIARNHKGKDLYDKLSLSLIIEFDLFLSRDAKNFIAYPNASEIVGCTEVEINNDTKLSLNGKKCIIQLRKESSPLMRNIYFNNGMILCTTDSNTQEGTFIIKDGDPIYKIGVVKMIIYEYHKELVEKMLSTQEKIKEFYNKETKGTYEDNDYEDIMIINTDRKSGSKD